MKISKKQTDYLMELICVAYECDKKERNRINNEIVAILEFLINTRDKDDED